MPLARGWLGGWLECIIKIMRSAKLILLASPEVIESLRAISTSIQKSNMRGGKFSDSFECKHCHLVRCDVRGNLSTVAKICTSVK